MSSTDDPRSAARTGQENTIDLEKVSKDTERGMIIGAQFVFGVVAGGYVGHLFKRFSREALYHVGASVLFLEYLQHKKWIIIHWKKASQDTTKLLDVNNDGKFDFADLKVMARGIGTFFKDMVPLGAGLGLGFWSSVTFVG